MQVTVHYFAVLRERAGCSEAVLDIEPAMTVGGLYEKVFPVGSQGLLPVMFAVNQEYVPAEHPLKDRDEVAFIPPLGGG
jgi:molybdopterin converting factor subunit 1